MSLGNKTYNISLPKDEDGYVGRECPIEECKGYFKIFPGTGLSEVDEGYCPYCGYKDSSKSFTTPEQIEYAKSIAFNSIMKDVFQELKKIEFSSKPRGAFGIGIDVKVKEGRPIPIHEYQEKELETKIECSHCSLKYEIYGVFGYCPDCGQHNSEQILNNNLNIVEKMLSSLWSDNSELNRYLLEDALSRCISLFDGYGREICKVNSYLTLEPEKAEKISFQNIIIAKEKLSTLFGIDMNKVITDNDWNILQVEFQKRHLISHKLGIIDDDYIRRSGDPEAYIGRKITLNIDEISNLIRLLKIVTEYIEYSFHELSNNHVSNGKFNS